MSCLFLLCPIANELASVSFTPQQEQERSGLPRPPSAVSVWVRLLLWVVHCKPPKADANTISLAVVRKLSRKDYFKLKVLRQELHQSLYRLYVVESV